MDGKTFTVVAKGLSKANKYVKSVSLNGRPVADWKLRHADIVKGGELVFEMDDDLPPPAKHDRISKTLRIGSDTELRLDRFSVVRLAPGSDCPMIENRGYVGGGDSAVRLLSTGANRRPSPKCTIRRACPRSCRFLVQLAACLQT